MAEVKWIKIVTDIFDDEKILLIESLPSADGILVIWFKLLCLAGKNNNKGVFTLNDRIAYTDEMLATIFRRELNTVRLALGIEFIKKKDEKSKNYLWRVQNRPIRRPIARQTSLP